MADKRINNGGARKGAGRLRKFKEPTTLNFKVELSDKMKVKQKFGTKLNRMFNDWLKSLLD